MYGKYLLTVAGLALAFMICSSLVKCASNGKDDVIIKNDSSFIFAKQYNTKIGVNLTTASFTIKYDSTYKAFKQEKVMYDGKILEVNEDEEYVKILQDNKKVFIKNTFANHHQYSDIEDNIGKNIIVTQYYYPKERIRYKIK